MLKETVIRLFDAHTGGGDVRRTASTACIVLRLCHSFGMIDDFDFAKACFVKDPDTGEVLAVEHTTEYSRAVLAFHAAECKHPTTAQYRVEIANGAKQVRNCCTTCGERIGSAVGQRDKAWVDSLPWQPAEHAVSYGKRREAERQTMLLDLARRQHAERGRFTTSYTEYLKSETWREKRRLVLKRCGDVCEGCGNAEATEVHHQTYEHLFNEFLFELFGLCHDCHERITVERRFNGGDDRM